jgi:hypothetical protein
MQAEHTLIQGRMSAADSPEAVFNQPPPLENYNLFESDCALKEAVGREGGGWIDAEARKLGGLLGKPETINLGVEKKGTGQISGENRGWNGHEGRKISTV